MAVDTLTSRDLFRLTLATPATVDPLSGEVALTTANLGGSGGVGSFTTLTASGNATIGGDASIGDDLLVAGDSTLTGAAAVGGALTAGSILVRTDFAVDQDGFITMILPVFADNAAALLGGLVVGNVYRTATGELRIVV